MIGDKTKFAKLDLKEEGFVTYGDNNKGRIVGNGVISNESSFNIKNVLLVEGLKHNLISIRQLLTKALKSCLNQIIALYMMHVVVVLY